MSNTIYIDKNTMPGALGLLFRQNVQIVYTGLEVQSEKDDPILSEISRLCGLDFFPEGREPEVPLYGVPYLWVFASDGRGGWLTGMKDSKDSPVYHIGPERSVRLVADHFAALLHLMVSDPDWRQKHLPGGPWPRLPEDKAGRRKLSESLCLPCPASDTSPGAPPTVFSSREEAEKVFPIEDVWTVLRQKKEPRFQVHPMMSPADREGRAFVHYTAWQETYTGLMPESILAAHTLEHCRRIAEKGDPDHNFVVLDRKKGDRVAGLASISHRARNFVSVPDAREIAALYVLREYQGLGLGKMLMEHCLARLQWPRVALFVLEGNEKAIGFYEHMGFRLTGHVHREETKSGILTELEMVLERENAADKT